MRYFLLFIFAFLFGCVREPPPGPVDPVRDAMNKWAKEFEEKLQGAKIVVMNFKNAGKIYYTQLGRDLACEFSQELSTCNKISLIVRDWGAEATKEEFKYIPDALTQEELKELLTQFQADYAIIGEYELTSNTIDFKKLIAIKTLGARGIGVPIHKIELANSAYKLYQEKDKKLIWQPGTTREPPFFVEEQYRGEWNAINEVRLVDLDNNILPERPTLSDGTYYRIKVEIDLICLPVYLYVFGWDDDDNFVSLLYPMHIIHPEEPFVPITRSTVIIPCSLSYQAQLYNKERGREHNLLVIFATKEPLNIEIREDWYNTSVWLSEFKRAFDRLGEENWSSGRVEFWIRE